MQKTQKKSKNRSNFANFSPKLPKNPSIAQKLAKVASTSSLANSLSSIAGSVTKTPAKALGKTSEEGDEVLDFAQVNFMTVSEHSAGQRLDNFLLSRLKGLPKSHLYKLIRDGEIRLNKKRAKPHERLFVGDVLRLAPIRLSTPKQAVVGDELQKALLEAVVYEDDGLMVLNKPCGMAVHGGSGESVGVIEAMRVATGKKYLELVHRIDKGTSGLLMIAKKRSTLKSLQDALREKTLQKTYLAIVAGHVSDDELMIDKPLLKYTLPNGERRVRVSADGKPSMTDVEVLARLTVNGQQVSLIKAMPKTGRTHQIRVHLASVGHPLLGDDKYHLNDTSKAHRLFLHAYRLSIADMPTMTAPMPNAFRAYLGDWQGDL